MSSIARRRKLSVACRWKSSSKICRSTRCRNSVRRGDSVSCGFVIDLKYEHFTFPHFCHFDRREKSLRITQVIPVGIHPSDQIILFSRRHFFISFSLDRAELTSFVSSKYTSLSTLYFSVNPF